MAFGGIETIMATDHSKIQGEEIYDDVCKDPTSVSTHADSSEHNLQTTIGEEESEVERLISAAENLALERAKFKLCGLISGGANITPLLSPLVNRTRGEQMDQSLSSATTLSAREASSVCQRVKGHGSCEKLIPPANSADTLSHYSHTYDREVEHSCLLTDHSLDASVLVDSDKNTCRLETLRGSLASSIGNSVLPVGDDFSSFMGTKLFVSKESTYSEEAVKNVPRLSLEHTNESGYSSQPHDEHQAEEMPSINVSVTEECQLEDKPSVSKDEKDVCNSSIRGMTLDSLDDEVASRCEGGEKSEHYRSLVVHGLEPTEVSSMVKDGCSELITLALRATNSLQRAIRLVRRVVKPDSPLACRGNFEEEVEEYVAQEAELESQFTAAASRLQVAVTGVQELEGLVREHDEAETKARLVASHLLQQVEAALLSSGLQHHLTTVLTSPRSGSSIRAVESAVSGITIVAGELERRGQRIISLEEQLSRQSHELQELREALLLGEARVHTSEIKLCKIKDQAKSDVTALQQCLAQAEESLRDEQLERMKMNSITKKHTAENSAVITDMRKKLCEVQHKAETRTTELEHQLKDSETARRTIEASLGEVQDQLTLRIRQMHLTSEENNNLIEGLRMTLKQQKEDEKLLRQQLETVTTEKTTLSENVHDIKAEVLRCEEQIEELQRRLQDARDETQQMCQEHTHSQKILQDKVDSLSLTRCELESKIRSLDLTVLQLRTEHQLEKQRIQALSDENTDLQKKSQDLQTRLWKEARRSRNNSGGSMRWSFEAENIVKDVRLEKQKILEYESNANLVSQRQTTLPTVTTEKNIIQCKNVGEDVERSFDREEQLHTLLREKDTELHSLHNTFSQQLSTKNEELESLTEKLKCLENEMTWVMSGLEASAALGDVTAEVGRQLQARSHHLEDLDQESRALHQQYSQLSSENNSLTIAAAAAHKEGREEAKDAREDARRAREEARRERLNTAHIQEKCQQLQAKLDAALSSLEQERSEKHLNQVVQGIKHHEFSSVLNSVTTGNHLTLDLLHANTH